MDKTNSKKFKVQFTKVYVVDVWAGCEKGAEKLATSHLNEKMRDGIDHYYETETPDITCFDVTDTEDPFNPEN